MRTASVVFDAAHRHLSVFNALLPDSELIGRPVEEFLSPDKVAAVRHAFNSCLATGNPVAYRVRYGNGLFLVRLKRFTFDRRHFIHCVSVMIPQAVETLAPDDLSFLCLLGQREQKDVAHLLGVPVQSVSRRERRLRERLGVDSRYELRRIGQELYEERMIG